MKRSNGSHHRPAGRLRAALGAADAILVSTPEYNASLPGALKNALDWASRPFPDNCLRGTPVAVLGASTSLFGAVWAQAELRLVTEARLPAMRLPDVDDDEPPFVLGTGLGERFAAAVIARRPALRREAARQALATRWARC
jgi:NAD(P)H-dependent FMN reductase